MVNVDKYTIFVDPMGNGVFLQFIFCETWILLFWVPVSSRIPTVNKGSAGGSH